MTSALTTMRASHLADVPTSMHAVRVNQVELHYTDTGTGTGTGTGTDGDPVILLHGGMGDLESWPHQTLALRSRYRVLAYSRRHSHPNRNDVQRAGPAHRIDDDVDDFLALQAALGTGPSHLIATSYGALIALAIALRAPAQVISLLLAEPPLHRWLQTTEAGARLYNAFIDRVWQAAGQAFEQGRRDDAMQLLTQGMWGRPTLDSWPEPRIAAAMRNAPAMRALTRARDPFPDLDRHAVSRLTMPTLLLNGEHTSPLHRLVMNELSAVMRHAKRIEIANAGHGSPNENPEAFTAAVVSFLQSL